MCDEADGIWDVHREDRRHAAKEHVCDGCSEAIRRGDLYINSATLYDGRWVSWKHCVRCDAIFKAIAATSEQTLAIDPHLNCGETFDSLFGSTPEHVAALAFWLPGEPIPEVTT